MDSRGIEHFTEHGNDSQLDLTRHLSSGLLAERKEHPLVSAKKIIKRLHFVFQEALSFHQ